MKSTIIQNRNQAVLAVRGGRMSSVTFIKEDGSLRTVNGQFGNRSRHGGGRKLYSDIKKNIITLYEFGAFAKGGYKAIRVDRIVSIKANKQMYYGPRWDETLK